MTDDAVLADELFSDRKTHHREPESCSSTISTKRIQNRRAIILIGKSEMN